MKPHRQRRRADDRPQELVEAAFEVFVERGYAATRIDDVAQRAGVSKATVYLYYASKLELFKAVVRTSLVASFDKFSTTQLEHISARDRLVLLLTTFMDRVTGSPLSGILKLVIAEAGNIPEMARFYHDEVIARARAMVVSTLTSGAENGEFRTVDVDYAWRIIVAPFLLSIIWKHSFQAFDETPLDLRRHLRAQLDLLFDGLRTDEGKFSISDEANVLLRARH